MREIHAHYRSWDVVVLLDEDSSHTASASQRLAAELAIELLWLPKRCPELNLCSVKFVLTTYLGEATPA